MAKYVFFFCLIVLATIWSCRSDNKINDLSSSSPDSSSLVSQGASEPGDTGSVANPSKKTTKKTINEVLVNSRKWALGTIVEKGKSLELVDKHKITLQIGKGKITGSGGCNKFTADYTLTSDSLLQVTNFSSSKGICKKMMGQELKVFNILQSATRLLEKNGHLEISAPDKGVMVLW